MMRDELDRLKKKHQQAKALKEASRLEIEHLKEASRLENEHLKELKILLKLQKNERDRLERSRHETDRLETKRHEREGLLQQQKMNAISSYIRNVLCVPGVYLSNTILQNVDELYRRFFISKTAQIQRSNGVYRIVDTSTQLSITFTSTDNKIKEYALVRDNNGELELTGHDFQTQGYLIVPVLVMR
jgi:hypothetical protein